MFLDFKLGNEDWSVIRSENDVKYLSLVGKKKNSRKPEKTDSQVFNMVNRCE